MGKNKINSALIPLGRRYGLEGYNRFDKKRVERPFIDFERGALFHP